MVGTYEGDIIGTVVIIVFRGDTMNGRLVVHKTKIIVLGIILYRGGV